MKKGVGLVISVILGLSLMACGGKSTDTGEISGITNEGDSSAEVSGEVSAEILERLGITEEEFAAMDPGMQQAILDEMKAVIEHDKKEEEEEQEQQKAPTYTPDDVMAGGSYVVVLGDYMNSITLYYENGVLVKIVEKFQKNSEEEAEVLTYEGDGVAEYRFNFIDWDGASLQTILDGMKDYGGFGNYKITKSE